MRLFENEDKLEMPTSCRRQQQQHYHHRNGDGPSGAGNGHSSASTLSSTSPSSTTARPAHTKVLRAKDNSYSEGILQDFRREEIPTELAQFYDLKDIIGIGTTSKVYRCKRRARQTVYACKVIDKRKLNMEVDNKDLLLEQLRKEIEILQHLHHPNIVEFEDVIETADKIFVIMELVQGGELFEYLLDRGPLQEDVALHVFRQVMGAITYMHDRGVVHRDLKAENLLVVDSTAEYPTVKLIDFGFSTILRHQLTGSFLGTGGYLAPEIRQHRMYSESVDIWACGVLLYLLLSCRLPFNADVEVLPSNRAQVARKFELSFPEAVWRGKSESVKDLLRRMLVTNPLERFSAHQVIKHPWTLYGTAADAKRNKNNKARKEGGNVKGGKPPPFQAKPKSARGEFLENPQESSGYVSKTKSGSRDGDRTPISGNGTGLLRSSMAGQHHVQQSYQQQVPGAGNGTHALQSSSSSPYSSSPSSPSPSMSMAAAMVINQDGNIRHVRSHLNLDRMRLPVNTAYSRTPPTTKASPLRHSTTLQNGDGNGRSREPRIGGHQKPVLVSYFPQTLHNTVAGDLSSTSNLSLKFAMNNAKAPPMNYQRTPPGAMPPVGGGLGGLVENGGERVVAGICG